MGQPELSYDEMLFLYVQLQGKLKAKVEEIERLKKVIKDALRIKDLWTLKEVESMFEDEAKALNLMAESFEKALKC